MDKFSFVVVDDAVFMRTLLKKMLEEAGFSVLGQASNGYEAIDEAKKCQPDIMTLDITMPDMDGIKAVKEVLKVSPKTRIIMVSAMGQQSMVIEAIKLGARDFVVKPFEKSRVLEAVKNVMS
ncbi:MAG: response regulator [Bacillota bacterium]|nr:response regulator [Bacillota bacterium]